jgi:hypothetical protein
MSSIFPTVTSSSRCCAGARLSIASSQRGGDQITAIRSKTGAKNGARTQIDVLTVQPPKAKTRYEVVELHASDQAN